MNEIKAQFFVTLQDGQFYERMTDTSTNAHYDEPLDVAKFDRLANGYRWSMAVRYRADGKRLLQNGMTTSIAAMLPRIEERLQNNIEAQVYCMTPDIEIIFTA